jgi:hypothetical protein
MEWGGWRSREGRRSGRKDGQIKSETGEVAHWSLVINGTLRKKRGGFAAKGVAAAVREGKDLNNRRPHGRELWAEAAAACGVCDRFWRPLA